MIDEITQRWIRNESDNRAVHAGCRFDEERAAWVVWWIETHCRLYEGEWAGQPLILCGVAALDGLVPIVKPWEQGGRDDSLLRCQAHNECLAAGHPSDWQYEVTARLFGWVRYNEKWKREIRRFRIGSIWVPKKNKKSPTIAALGLYLMCGDGEPGQKVFCVAKDGKQARSIVGQHAALMVEQSPLLSVPGTCGFNKTTGRISHYPSHSYLEPLSSGSLRTQQAKEGFNGSLVIDETHVVDRAFMGRLTRAGISRSEPFQIEASTAGEDLDCYGKDQHDYGKRVEAGAHDDVEFFFITYEAPQDMTDEQLAADPLKYGRIANPAWGHTIDPEEFLTDYRRSCVKLDELRRFKMYRLNIWQQGGFPWLRLGEWLKGRLDYTAEEMAGRECFGGLDMGRTRDLTSFCLAFPEPDEVTRFLWWHWVPEAYAHAMSDKAPFLDMADDPGARLMLTPGEVVDIPLVRNAIRTLAGQYKIRAYAYDDWNAEVVTQEISEGLVDERGQLRESGLGIERVAFSQRVKAFNEPTKEFERRVILGNIHHTGNPLMSWQVQHATLYEDTNGNIKPVKPGRDSPKKVDGLITGIMAFDLSRRLGRASASVYDTRGVLEV